MKKLKTFLLTLLTGIMAVCCVLFAGCGADTAGTYKLQSVEAEGIIVNTGESYMGIMLDENFMTVTLNKDGSASMTAMGETVEGTWEETNESVLLTVEGEVTTLAKDGDTLCFEDDETKIIMKK